MEYPHRRYLVYLVSKGRSVLEIRQDCAQKGLVAPFDEDCEALRDELGPTPRFWRAQVTRENVKFRRWLRDKRLLALWKQDAATKAAFGLLYRHSVRKDFENIFLAHGSIDQAYNELIIKYPPHLVPEVPALNRYVDFFWNIGDMTPQGIMDYLENMQDGEDYLPAVHGDITTTYGMLGLPRKVDSSVYLEAIRSLGYQAAIRAGMNPNASGSSKMGDAALIKLGMDADQKLYERGLDDEGDQDLRKEAADFQPKVVHARRIPSYDEVVRDVIDADEVEEAGNVRRLPVR